MRTKIIRIGNSRGIRLTKTLLDQYQIGDEVNLRMEEAGIVIEPVRKPRSGWDEIFNERALEDADDLLIQDVFEDESFEEWG